MKKLSIILVCALVALLSCTKSKEVHPEIGDGNDEIVTVGIKDVHVEYSRTDHAELSRVMFHYSFAEVQQFDAAEMTKRETLFELTLNDLLCDTLYSYYYELFFNGGETSKTNRKTFRTQVFDTPEPPEPPTPPSGAPEGAINGLFTINENGDQVYFSQGNLQYNKATNEWSFMEHQYDRVEADNQDVGDNYSNQNIVSLFGWSTSGYNHGANCYLPYSTSQTSTDYFAYGNWEYNLYDQTGQADWGYNAISNGGNQENCGWRTLTVTEWDFLISRSNSSGILWAKGIVNGVNGVILLPDNWDSNYYPLNHDNTYAANDINLTDWNNSLEAKGAVFLPAACTRYGSSILTPDSHAFYWSSCTCHPDIVYLLYFNDSNLCTDGTHYGRFNGGSVRLVKAVK